jgi:hypothetical protein
MEKYGYAINWLPSYLLRDEKHLHIQPLSIELKKP